MLDAGRDTGGNRHRSTRSGFTTRTEARAALREAILAGSSRNPDMHRMTVETYLRQWLDGKRALRPSTRRSYREHLELYLVPHLGHLRLKNLAAAHVDAMVTDLLGGGPRRRSAATVRRIHATLRTALNAAVRRQLIAINPATQVELPAEERDAVVVWTPAQLTQFLMSTRRHRLYALFHLVAVTGLRRGEVLGLRWVDVDEQLGLLFVNQQVVQVGGSTHIGPPKTKAGRRVVPLDTTTVRLIGTHREHQERERALWGDAWLDTGLVFTREDGTQLSPEMVSRLFKRLTRTAALPVIRFHGLRHTSASLALAAGVAMKVVSDRLGHSTTGITADLYTHVVPAVAQDAADAIARLIAVESGKQ
jgi:integrase